MSDLKERADELANDLCVNHGLDAHDAIRDAILQGMVEALEAEPDEGMAEAGIAAPILLVNLDSISARKKLDAKTLFRAMAAARVKQIKENT